MSYDSFGTAAYLQTANNAFSSTYAYGWSVVAWVKRTGTNWSLNPYEFVAMFAANNTTQVDAAALMVNGAAPDRARVRCASLNTSTGQADYDFTTDAYDDEWVVMVGTVTAADDRSVFIENSTNTTRENVTTRTLTALDTVSVGWNPQQTSAFFDGQIAEVAFFDKALSASEIDALQTATGASAGGPPPNTVASANCIAYWPLDSDQASHADQSGNGGPALAENGTVAYNADHPTITSGGIVLTDVISVTDGSPIQ
jgi:hypothetical protein